MKISPRSSPRRSSGGRIVINFAAENGRTGEDADQKLIGAAVFQGRAVESLGRNTAPTAAGPHSRQFRRGDLSCSCSSCAGTREIAREQVLSASAMEPEHSMTTKSLVATADLRHESQSNLNCFTTKSMKHCNFGVACRSAT
jgi:hypothetical protein